MVEINAKAITDHKVFYRDDIQKIRVNESQVLNVRNAINNHLFKIQ